MAIWEDDRMNAKPRYNVAPANFQDWREQSRAFEQVAAYIEGSINFAGGGDSVACPARPSHPTSSRRSACGRSSATD